MQAESPAARGQSHSLTLAAVLAAVQGIDFLVLAALAAVVGVSAAKTRRHNTSPPLRRSAWRLQWLGCSSSRPSRCRRSCSPGGCTCGRAGRSGPWQPSRGSGSSSPRSGSSAGWRWAPSCRSPLLGRRSSPSSSAALLGQPPARDRGPPYSSWRSCCQAVPSRARGPDAPLSRHPVVACCCSVLAASAAVRASPDGRCILQQFSLGETRLQG